MVLAGTPAVPYSGNRCTEPLVLNLRKGGGGVTFSRKALWIGGTLLGLTVLIVVLVIVYSGGGGSGGGGGY